MKKIKQVIKSTLALTLAAILIFAVPVTVNADTITVTMEQCKDSYGNPMVYKANVYNKNGTLVFGGNGLYKVRSIYVGAKTDKNRAYCIDPGSPLNHDNTLDTSELWETYSADLKKSINLAMLYGFSGSADTLVGNSDEKYIATQLIIWELIDGYRNLSSSDFKCTNNAYYNCLCINGNYPKVAENYKIISKELEHYKTIPSFSSGFDKTSPTITLNWDGSKYTATVNDTNKVLDKFDFKASGVSFEQNGNKLTITSKNPIKESDVIASSEKNIPQPEQASQIVAYGDLKKQDIIVGTAKADPPRAYFKLQTTRASLQIVKKDRETGETIPLKGFGFKVENEKGESIKAGNSDVFYTDSTGTVNVPGELDAGIYYITEVTAAGDYELSNKKIQVELDGSKPVVIAEFFDTSKKGSITVTKTGSILESIKVETLADGTVVKQPVWSTENEKITGASFELIAAEDIVTQDGTVRYRKGETVVEETPVGNNGKLTFSDLYFGKYTIIEKQTPTGYTKAQNVNITVDGSQPDVETEVVNYKRGLKVRIEKELEQDEANQINLAEEYPKVKFALYANSHINAGDSASGGVKINPGDLIEIASCDESGMCSFKTRIPVGKYYVQEIETSPYFIPDNTEKEFTITEEIQSDESGYFKRLGTVKNKVEQTPIEIMKVDAETGKPIAGCSIEIYSENKSLVYTGTSNSDGMFPDIKKLIAGTYTYFETEAPKGYQPDNNEYTFTVTGKETEPIKLTIEDKPIMGNIEITKFGEIFASVSESTDENGITTYIPNFTNGSLEGAKFEIYADGDIVTGDGTVRVHDGEVADTLITSNKGTATSSNLYLGSYIIKEVEAPKGYSITFDEIKFTLSDNYTFVTADPIGNVRNKVNVKLNKVLENDKLELINITEEIKKVSFGLFADEKIEGADGSFIPQDGLIEKKYCDENGDIFFSADLPNGKYYVVELETSPYFKLDDTKHKFTVNNETEHTEDLTDNGSFVNEIITTQPKIRKVAADTGLPLAGAKIEIKFGDTVVYTGTSQSDGTFADIPELPIGTYTYKEIEAPAGYKLDTNTYTFEVTDSEDDIELTLKDEIIMGNISVTKHGEVFATVEEFTDESGTVTYYPKFSEGKLEGAEFTIYAAEAIVTPDGKTRYEQGAEVDVIITSDDGTATSKDLYIGQYIIKETKAPKGYKLSPIEIPFEIKESNNYTSEDVFTEFDNEKNNVTVKLNKVLENDELGLIDITEEIKKVVFGLFADEEITANDGTVIPKNGLIEKKYCDENGDIFFSADLPNGKYYVVELETSPYFKLDNTKHEFTVNNETEHTEDLTANGSFVNEIITTQPKIRKVAADTGLPLEGAKIEIKFGDTVVYTGTSQSDGTFADTPKLPIGTYTYKEIEAPEGYQLDTKTYTFEVTNSEDDIELTLKDEIIMGKITVLKVGERFTEVIEGTDSDGTETYQPKFAEGNLKNAKFNIIAKDDIVTPDGTLRYNKDEVVETITTGEDGTATSSDLYLGTYLLVETEAPNEFDRTEEEFEITLTPNNHIITTNPVGNNRHKVNITLTKTMENDEWDIIDTKKELQKVSFGIFANEDIYADNGSYIPKDGLIEKKNCNENGIITFSTALPFGSYYVKEIETSEYYVLENSKRFFNIDYTTETSSAIEINLNEDGEFVNQLDRTQLDFKKVAKDTSSPLAGAEIEISYEGKVIYTGVTGINGKLSDVPKLIHGTYTYRELTAPEGYLLDTNTYTFTVDGTQRVIELVMENIPKRGGIEITKTDIATDKALPNCGIRILDKDGNVLIEKKTDSNGKVLFDNLPVGNYYYQEFEAPAGYKINTDKFPFEIKENGVIIKAVLKDEKIEETPNTPGTPTTPTTPTTPVTPSAPETPKVTTGQVIHNSVFVALLLLSAGLIIFTNTKMKKLSKKEED